MLLLLQIKKHAKTKSKLIFFKFQKHCMICNIHFNSFSTITDSQIAMALAYCGNDEFNADMRLKIP